MASAVRVFTHEGASRFLPSWRQQKHNFKMDLFCSPQSDGSGTGVLWPSHGEPGSAGSVSGSVTQPGCGAGDGVQCLKL